MIVETGWLKAKNQYLVSGYIRPQDVILERPAKNGASFNNGGTDISASSTTTFDQGFIVASRMDAWVERNFSKNITAGVDFMDNVAAQIADYKYDVLERPAKNGASFNELSCAKRDGRSDICR